MIISILIPTYRRPKDLARCLEALKVQTRLSNQVIIIVRDIDTETLELLKDSSFQTLPIYLVKVNFPGVVAAMNAGLKVATGDIISITDDDAAPHPDWVERIESHFLSDQNLGGVGGRDWIYSGNQLQDASMYPGASKRVGQMRWDGRVTGNHHLGEGSPREVYVLKGVNSSYRHAAIANIGFDTRLKGEGAQVHWELSLCLKLRKTGWKLVYDPLVAVDHYPGKRFDKDQRDILFNKDARIDEVHNETLVLLENLPLMRKLLFMISSIFVGTRSAFGLLQWVRFLQTDGNDATEKWKASMIGLFQGLSTYRQ